MKIAFIGYGNLAKAIHKGLKDEPNLEFGCVDTNEVDRNIEEFKDICALLHSSKYIFLTVKPQDLTVVLEEIREYIRTRGKESIENKIFISPAAGVKISFIQNYLGSESSIIRIMPNLAIQYGKSITAYCTNAVSSFKYSENSENERIEKFENIIGLLSKLGEVIELDESGFDLFTALYGSGPAFILKILESFMYKSLELGVSKDEAYDLIIVLLKGTTAFMENNKTQKSMRDLISKVASKGGTTEAGLNFYNESNLGNLITEVINKGKERSEELSK